MNPNILVEQGGFAFAALGFAALLILTLRFIMGFFDRLLVRLDKTEAAHDAMLTTLQEHNRSAGLLSETNKAILANLTEVQIALARQNGKR